MTTLRRLEAAGRLAASRPAEFEVNMRILATRTDVLSPRMMRVIEDLAGGCQPRLRGQRHRLCRRHLGAALGSSG
jgi:hypothetical protein